MHLSRHSICKTRKNFTLFFFYFDCFLALLLFHLHVRFNYANHVWRRIKINWREICIFIEHLLSDGVLADFHQPLQFSCIHTSFQWRTGKHEREKEREKMREHFPRERIFFNIFFLHTRVVSQPTSDEFGLWKFHEILTQSPRQML